MNYRLSLLLAAIALNCFSSARSQGLTNGGFESGLAAWSTSLTAGGVASFAVSNSLAHWGGSTLFVSVTNAGTATNSVRLVSSSFNATSTNTYILRFWANTDVLDANLGVNLIGATPVFPQISFMLSTNSRAAGDQHYQEYLYAFKATGTVSIAFNFQSAARYWLDDVEILDLVNTHGFDVPMTYLWQWGQWNFARTNSTKIGWGGGDNNKSALLPDGTVAWIFNDSYASTLNSFYSNIRGNSSLPRNAIVHQIGTNLIYKNNGNNSFFVPSNLNDTQMPLAPNGLYWIAGSIAESNKLYVLLNGLNNSPLSNICMSVATLSLPNLTLDGVVTNLISPGTDNFGDLVRGEDGYYYIYNAAKVARVPAGQLAVNSAWTYWNGSGWTTNHLLNVAIPNFQGWSIARLSPSNYVAVYKPVLSLDIYAQFAPTPMGPWGNGVVVASASDEGGEGIFSAYMPNICMGTGGDGIYTIGYSDNGAPESWFSKTYSDKSWYNPHFVTANLRQISPYTPFTTSTNFLLTGSVVGTSGIGSSTGAKAFDSNLTTYFDALGGTGWVGLDLGATNQKILTALRYCPRTNNASRMIGGMFQGANAADFSDAVTLYTVTIKPFEGVFTAVTSTNTTAYRYLRYLGTAGSYCIAAELQFYGTTLPSAPASLTATPGNHTVSLSWPAVASATGYNVKRATHAAGPFAIISAGQTNLTCFDTGLENLVTNYYQVTSVSLGLESTNAAAAGAMPAGPPDVPAGLMAIASTNHLVTLNWQSSGGATGYFVRRATVSGGAGTVVGNPAGTHFIDSAPVNGTTYFYAVNATNGYGLSADSAEMNAQPGGYGSWLQAAGAMAWWRLNETSGTVALDAIGNNPGLHNAVTLGATGAVGDGFGSPHFAARYNGTSAYTQIPNLIGGTNFTLTFWVQTTATGGTANWYNGLGLVDGEMAGTATDFGTALVGARLGFGVGSADTTLLSAKSINDGQWHFIAAERNVTSGAMLVFIDGAFDASRTGPAGARTAATNLRIGSLQTGVAGGFLNGAISDVAFYPQLLSAAQITKLYNAGAGIFYDVTLGQQGSGTNCLLTWPGGGKLVQAADLAGPWSAVSGATSPYSLTPTNTQQFYRIQVQ